MFTREELNSFNVNLNQKKDVNLNRKIKKFQRDFRKKNGYKIQKLDIITLALRFRKIFTMNDYNKLKSVYVMQKYLATAINDYIDSQIERS